MVKDFPKLHSPFVRVQTRGGYVVTPEVAPGYEWVFNEPGVKAVDKLHGTNLCVHIEGGYIESIHNRTAPVYVDGKLAVKGTASKFLIGVLNACNRDWLKEDGVHYGELIGPDINKNIHCVRDYFFVPFQYLASKCHWNSWLHGEYPRDYTTISDWFKELPSLFTKHVVGLATLAEGLVFTAPDGRMAKLRRDMFPWFSGEKHKETE